MRDAQACKAGLGITQSRRDIGGLQIMTDAITETTRSPRRRPETTDLERRVQAHEHTSGVVSQTDQVRVEERHGIWTVTGEGAFVGDYHEQETALEAASLARLSLRKRQR